MNSVLNCIDFYKADHKSQYPAGLSEVMSNFTPRYSRIPQIQKVVLFGLQYYIKEYLINQWNETFFKKEKTEVINRYKRRMKNSGINITYEHVEALHDLGYLPIKIYSLPEGASVPIKCPMFLIVNTHPDFAWLVNYLETQLSATIWSPCTSATIAKEYKRIFIEAMIKSGAPLEFVNFMGHDFSYRGMSSQETAEVSGAAHLLSFNGTDTIPAIDFLETYYNADSDKEFIGCSVPATEHSVMCAGSKESEFETYKRLICDVYPTGIVSIVSDTYDYWKVWTDYIPALKQDILNRYATDRNSKVVIRPDSGDPVKIICGEDYETYFDITDALAKIRTKAYNKFINDCLTDEGNELPFEEQIFIFKVDEKFYKVTYNFNSFYEKPNANSIIEVSVDPYIPSPEFLGSFELAWSIFGGKINNHGFKELHPAIGLIYGDSITMDRAKEICDKLIKKGFVPSMVFGIGSYTYQYNTRDTFGFAIKATNVIINNKSIEIFKDPKTDNGVKKSAKGLTAVFENNEGEYYLKDQCTIEEFYSDSNKLKPVFEDGELLIDQSLAEIRARI